MNETAAQVRTFAPDRVKPLAGQPRKRFRGIAELAASIAEVGQATPGLVTILRGDPDHDAQLIDGERRLQACLRIGVGFRAEVTAGVGALAIPPTEVFARSFAANFGKQDHDAIEIAEALEKLRDGRSIEKIAALAGKSPCWVSQHLSLLKLCPAVRELMYPNEEGVPKLTFSIAQLLTPLPAETQLSLAKKIANKSMAGARRLVLLARRKAGAKETRRIFVGKTGAKRALAGLRSLAEKTNDRLGIYLDLPGHDLNQLIDGASLADRRILVAALREAADSLTALAEAVAQRNEAATPKVEVVVRHSAQYIADQARKRVG